MELLQIIIGCIVVGGFCIYFMVKISRDYDELFKTYSDEEVTEDWEHTKPETDPHSYDWSNG
jgi:hypothetical protein